MGEPFTLSLPPGFYQNGTPYSAKNRWAGGNLVRWVEGTLQSVQGWERRRAATGALIPALWADPSIEAARNAMVWQTNDGNSYLLIGTNAALYVITASGVVSNVTPAGFVAGAKDEAINSGFGGSYYGVRAYGTARENDDFVLPVFTWELDTWGEEALASDRGDTAILRRWAVGDAAFTTIAAAPVGFNAFVVTDERFVMLLGSPNDPRLVQWCDREDYNVWNPLATNQAGSRRLEGKGKLLTGKNILGGTLILSETDAYFARYVNPPFVYGFQRVGIDCGPLSSQCVVRNSDMAMWIGKEGFFAFDGRIREISCEVMDYFLSDRSPSALSKVHSMHVPKYNEFWWLYQSTNANEVDSYIAFDYTTGTWLTGRINRTVGVSAKPMAIQIMVSADGLIYNHEVAGVAPAGATPYAETGPIELGEGKFKLFVQRVYPDEQFLGGVSLTIYGRDMPTDNERTYGPFTMRNPTPVKAQGREIRMRVDQLEAGWKVGNGMRFEVASAEAASVR